MRAPGDILLVSCYEPGYQPLAVASPAAFLVQAGYAPRCLDLAVEDLETVGVQRLKVARLVAISVPMHTAMVLGLRVAERVRAVNPTAHICFYGLYAHLNRALLLDPTDGADAIRGGDEMGSPRRRPIADTVFGPECEETLVELANTFRHPNDLALLSQSAATMSASASASASARRLHRLPFLRPERQHLPPLERYARLLIGKERRVTGYVETTRGCLYLCRHCPIPPFYEGRFFAVPAEVVLDDVRAQVAGGARHIVMGDPDFLNSAKHALAIARQVHAAHPDLTFSFTAKVEHIIAHRGLFAEFAALGCLFVVSAVESLSDRVLRILDKRHVRGDVYAALQIVRGAGISLRPTFVAFTPWTTLSDYIDLCDLIATQALQDEVDPVQLAIRLLIPPGSLLLERPELTPFLDPAAFDARSLTHSWKHPDPRMDRLYEQVSEIAEEAARVNENPATTFRRIHEMAAAAAADGRHAVPSAREGAARAAAEAADAPAGGALPGEQRRPAPPRLSEPWFCCAQPTRAQLTSSCGTPPTPGSLSAQARSSDG